VDTGLRRHDVGGDVDWLFLARRLGAEAIPRLTNHGRFVRRGIASALRTSQ